MDSRYCAPLSTKIMTSREATTGQGSLKMGTQLSEAESYKCGDKNPGLIIVADFRAGDEKGLVFLPSAPECPWFSIVPVYRSRR